MVTIGKQTEVSSSHQTEHSSPSNSMTNFLFKDQIETDLIDDDQAEQLLPKNFLEMLNIDQRENNKNRSYSLFENEITE